jgi:hypothetical protein
MTNLSNVNSGRMNSQVLKRKSLTSSSSSQQDKTTIPPPKYLTSKTADIIKKYKKTSLFVPKITTLPDTQPLVLTATSQRPLSANGNGSSSNVCNKEAVALAPSLTVPKITTLPDTQPLVLTASSQRPVSANGNGSSSNVCDKEAVAQAPPETIFEESIDPTLPNTQCTSYQSSNNVYTSPSPLPSSIFQPAPEMAEFIIEQRNYNKTMMELLLGFKQSIQLSNQFHTRKEKIINNEASYEMEKITTVAQAHQQNKFLSIKSNADAAVRIFIYFDLIFN